MSTASYLTKTKLSYCVFPKELAETLLYNQISLKLEILLLMDAQILLTGLTKIKIPKSVVELGKTAFFDCKNADVEINNPVHKVRQGKFVFGKCKSVKWK